MPPDVPILTIGCIDHKTYVFIDVNNPGDPEGPGYGRTVGIVLEGGQRSAERWTATRTGRAVFAPNPIALASRIASARSLLVDFKPFDRPPAQLTFNISLLSAHVMQVAQVCGWEYKADRAP